MDALVDAMYKKRGGDTLKPCYVGFSKLPSVSEQREMGVYKGCVARNIPFDREKDVIMVDSLTELREKVLPAIEKHAYNGVSASMTLWLFRSTKLPEKELEGA